MDKIKLLEIVINELKRERQSLLAESNAGEVNEEASQALATSYLEKTRLKRAQELEDTINEFKALKIKEFSEETPIDLTAFVEVGAEDDSSKNYFILPKCGGVKVNIENKAVMTLSPDSPLGQQIKGLKVGDQFDFKVQGALKEYEIHRVV